jgi:biopolymer transport protein ExbD
MRIKSSGTKVAEGDMTPMIDMTFQLIAFFMVLINFNQTDQTELIQLPESELARPVEDQFEYAIVINLTAADAETNRHERVILGGQEIEISNLGAFLVREVNEMIKQNKKPADATVVIRAHREAAAGKVQELIRVCQESRFEKFALRAKEEGSQ